MRRVLEKSESGWTLLSADGKPLKVMPELCFVADLKHGLALFPGTGEEAAERMESIRKRCEEVGAAGEAEEHLRLVCLGKEVDEAEAAYMLSTLMLPRRVEIRLKSGGHARVGV